MQNTEDVCNMAFTRPLVSPPTLSYVSSFLTASALLLPLKSKDTYSIDFVYFWKKERVVFYRTKCGM